MLKDALVKQGDWLFRWRSYVPLLIAPLVVYEFGRYTPFLGSACWNAVLEIVCFAVAYFGLAIRAHVVGHAPAGTSGRITKSQKASEVNTTGMYALCRNPLYLGNYFMMVGVLLFLHSIATLVIFTMFFWLYYERIILREEDFLHGEFGEDYVHWGDRTPVVIPRFSGWTPPALSFSWRAVLRREYSGFFAVIAAMTLFKLIGVYVTEGEADLNLAWRVVFLAGLIIYLALRTLKKKTRQLHEAGR